MKEWEYFPHLKKVPNEPFYLLENERFVWKYSIDFCRFRDDERLPLCEYRGGTESSDIISDTWRVSSVRLSSEQVKNWWYNNNEYWSRRKIIFIKAKEPEICKGFRFESNIENYGAIYKDIHGGESSAGRVRIREPGFHAVPEGPFEELQVILNSLKNNQEEGFNRIEIAYEDDYVWVWSPRNAHHPDDYLKIKKDKLISLLENGIGAKCKK